MLPPFDLLGEIALGLRVNQKYENQTLMRAFRISALFYDLQAPAEHVSD